ncbi:RraA family protein [Achromobacter spanius]|uniref:RraA family protein n=1 Tax=Achromobacter spanius TaxID=217203 RepID=UPI0032078F59
MYLIHPLPAALPPEDQALLLQAEPATIGHFQTTGFMRSDIRAHQQDVRIAGPAVTVRMPGTDGGILHHAMACVRPGDVLVIDRGGEAVTAALGGAMAYAAKQAGVAGIIVDGLVTDLGELRQHGMPVWSRGPSPITTRLLGLEGEFCGTIHCGGVTVWPGAAILADENGVLVLARGALRAAAQQAIDFQTREQATLARLRAGEKFPDIVGSRALIERAIAAAQGAQA